MSISFSGLASGLDTSSWVESLVALKKAKVTTLEEEKKEVQSLQETLTQIKSFFSSFRSMLEKVTDAKFGVASMDLFAQNLATSSNLEALTASATTEAEEATYNVLVDKLASETKANSNYSYMTTIVQTTTATGDSKLINLGVKTGNIGVTVNGVEHGISITENDTLSTFIEKLKNIGVNASFNEDSGIFSIDVSADAINDRYEGTTVDKTGIKDALHLSGVNEGYTSNSLQTSKTDTIFSAATETTKLSELGVKDGIVTITANGANYSITINGTTTLGEFIEELNKKHIDATLDKDGIFTISDAEITNEGTTDIKNALGLDSSIYGKTQITGNLTHQTTITQTTLATSDTLLKDLEGGENIKDGDTVIVKNSNNEYTTITVGTSTTLGNLLGEISNAGLYAARKADGTIEITGGTIEGGTFKAEDVLGLTREPYSAIVTGKPLTETVEVHKLVDLQTKLVDDLKVKEGYLEVTDANGNKYYEKIYSGQTIADFMTDMGNLGIQTSLDEETGVLTITGGAFKTLSDADVKALVANATIVEPDTRYQQGTNLLACLYGADTISTDQITVASTYSRTKALRHTVTNTINATKNTTLDKLGLSADGTATFDVRGESRTINLTTTMTISDLMSQLKDAGIGSSFDEDTSRLTIENATITGGTSDLATVLDLTTTISGKYVTSSELYVSDTLTIDATRDTLLKDYGISDTMTEYERTVTLYGDDGSKVLGSTIVGEGTTLGELIDWINTHDGVSANLKDGYLTINGGCINRYSRVLTDAMGLKLTIKSSLAIGSVITTTTTAAVTGETTLGSIFSTLGTLDYVKDGYNLKFNNKDIVVSASTTINELINAIYENGGTASLDHTGRLSVDGGTLTGSVAQALGMTSYTHTASVSATGEKLYVTENVYADRNTKLSDLGITNDTASYTIYNSLGGATTTVTLNTTATIGDFLDGLKTNGIDGIIANGVIKLDSAEGKYIQGALATALGLTTQTVTEVVSTTQMSTAQVKHTATLNADLATTMGELGIADPDNVFSIYDKNDQLLASFTITDASTTIEGFFNDLKAYDIVGSINNGVISLYSPSGNYIAGTLADKLGIATAAGENRTMTVGTTVTSTIAVTYTQDVKATEDMLLGDFISIPQDRTVTIAGTTTEYKGLVNSTIKDKNGNILGTITADNTTTFGYLFQQLGEYGIDADIHDGVIKLTSPEGNIISGGIADALGITTETITTTKTVGASVMSTAEVTYTSTAIASLTTKISDITGYKINGTITADGVTGTIIGISTAEDLVNLSNLVNNGKSMSGKTFIMTNDIDMSSVTNWTSIGKHQAFYGNFDGQGYTIKNFNLNNSDIGAASTGLFGTVRNATLKNIKFDNITFENTSTASAQWTAVAILADSARDTLVSNIQTKNVSVFNANYYGIIGGLLGNVTIQNCSTDATWSDDGTIGSSWQVSGIAGSGQNYYGDPSVTITGCSANLNAKGNIFLGSGIIVFQGSDCTYNISDCAVTGSIESVGRNSNNTSINGIIGAYAEANGNIHTTINIDHCYINAKLSADNQGYVNWITGGNYQDATSHATVNANAIRYNGTATITNNAGISTVGVVGIGSTQLNGDCMPDSDLFTYNGTNVTNGTFSYNYMITNGFSKVLWLANGKLKTQDPNSLLVRDKNGQVRASITVGSGSTMETLISRLSNYGEASLSSVGVLTFKGTDGNYITGPLADTLGISAVTSGTTTTVGATMTSTAAITYTSHETATLTTKLDDIVNTLKIDGTITADGVTGTVIGISTAQDLENLAKLSKSNSFSGKTFVLTNDIDLSSVSNWIGIGGDDIGFAGTFDGQGHTISNLSMTTASTSTTVAYAGLFRSADGDIKNFTLKDATFNLTANQKTGAEFGAVVAYGWTGTISNVTVDNVTLNQAGDGGVYGGIFGYGSKSFENCSVVGGNFNCEGSNNGMYGGIVGRWGYGSATMSNCQSSLTINTNSAAYFGGLVGQLVDDMKNSNEFTIENSIFTGAFNNKASSSNAFGGLIGEFACTTTSNRNISTLFISNSIFAGSGNELAGSVIRNLYNYDNSSTSDTLAVVLDNVLSKSTQPAICDTTGAGVSSNNVITGSATSADAKRIGFDTLIWDLSGSTPSLRAPSKYSLNIYNPSNGESVLNTTLSADSTIQDVINALEPYGGVTFADGVLTFHGDNGAILSGGLAEAFGITVGSNGTSTITNISTSTSTITVTQTVSTTTTTTVTLTGTVGLTTSSSSPVTYTITSALATASTSLNDLFTFPPNRIYLYNRNTRSVTTVTIKSATTVQDVVDALANYGSASFSDGRLSFTTNRWALLDASSYDLITGNNGTLLNVADAFGITTFVSTNASTQRSDKDFLDNTLLDSTKLCDLFGNDTYFTDDTHSAIIISKVLGGEETKLSMNSLADKLGKDVHTITLKDLADELAQMGITMTYSVLGVTINEKGKDSCGIADWNDWQDVFGFTSSTSMVTNVGANSIGESMYVGTVATITNSTTFGELSGNNSTYTITVSNNSSITNLTFSSSSTMSDVFSKLAEYNISGSISDGKVTFTPQGEYYITGGYAMSYFKMTGATYTVTAGGTTFHTKDTKIGEIAGAYSKFPTSVCNLYIYDESSSSLITEAINLSSTINDLVTRLNKYGTANYDESTGQLSFTGSGSYRLHISKQKDDILKFLGVDKYNNPAATPNSSLPVFISQTSTAYIQTTSGPRITMNTLLKDIPNNGPGIVSQPTVYSFRVDGQTITMDAIASYKGTTIEELKVSDLSEYLGTVLNAGRLIITNSCVRLVNSTKEINWQIWKDIFKFDTLTNSESLNAWKFVKTAPCIKKSSGGITRTVTTTTTTTSTISTVTTNTITTTSTVTNFYNTSGTAVKKTQTTLLDRTDVTFGELMKNFSSGTIQINNQNGIVGTISVTASSTLDDLFTQLAAYDIQAGLDSNGKVTIKSLGDNYISSVYPEIANVLKIQGQNSYTTTITTSHTNTASKTLKEEATRSITSATTLSELGWGGTNLAVVGSDIKIILDENGNLDKKTMQEQDPDMNSKISTMYFGEKNTLGDIFTWLAGHNISASIKFGKVVLNDDNTGSAEHGILMVENGDSFLQDLNLSTKQADYMTTKTSTTLANTTSDELVESFTKTMKTSTTLGDLGASGTLTVSFTQDGKDTTLTFKADDTVDDMLTALAGYGISGQVVDGKISLTGNKHTHITEISADLKSALKLGDNLSYSTVITEGTTVNTDSNKQTYEDTNAKLTGDTIISSIDGFRNGNGSLIVHKTDGSLISISIDASKTLDEFFEQISQYGIIGSVDSQGVVTITGVGNAYMYQETGGSNILDVLKLSNVATNVKTVTVNRTSNTLSHVATVAAKGTTTLENLQDKTGQSITFNALGKAGLILHAYSDAGNNFATIEFSKTDTIYDVIDKLAEYGIEAKLDADGRFSISSSTLTDFDLSGDLGTFLMGTYTKNYGEDTTNNVSTLLVENTIAKLNDNMKLKDLGISNGLIGVYTPDGNSYNITLDTDKTQTIGDFRNLLTQLGFTSFIDDAGRLNVMGVGNSCLTSGRYVYSNILSVLGLTDWKYEGAKQQSGHLTDTTEVVHKISMSDKLKDLTDSAGVNLGITAGQIYVYQDGTRSALNIDINDTLETLAAKLSQYGISVGISQEGKLYFDGNNDSYLTTDGIITANASNILQKFDISGNWSTRYDSTSKNLNYTENEDKKVSGSTKLSDLKDTNGNNLGITTGSFYVYNSGVRSTETITDDMTVNDLMSTLAKYGLVADFDENGVMSVGAYNNTYLATSALAGDNSNIVNTLFEKWNFVNIYKSNHLDIPTDEIRAITRDTKLADINEGTYEAGYITVVKDGVKTNISLTADDTVGTLMDELALYGFESVINDKGQLMIKNTGDSLLQKYDGTGKASNALELLGIDLNNWINTSTYDSKTLEVTSTTTNDVNASRDTLLSELGVSTGEYFIYNNGVKFTAMISSDETLGSFMDTLKSFGIETSLVDGADGSVLTIIGKGDSYIKKSTSTTNASNVVEKLFTSDAKSSLEYKGLEQTSSIQTTFTAATEDTLVSYFDKPWNGSTLTSAGDLTVEVNGQKNTIKISADETFGSLLEKFKALGLEATISKDGQIMIQSGYDTVTILQDGTTSNLLGNIGLTYQKDLGGYSASSTVLEATTSDIVEKTLSVANYADGATKMSLLNISDGSLTVYRDGQKATIQIKADETFDQLRTRLSTAFADLDLAFENGYLKIFSKDGKNVEVGSTTDTSNFSAITGIQKDENGNVISARELYCVNGDSTITTSGIFRRGDITKGTFTIGNAVFTIDDNTTLSGLIAQINSSDEANATAFWDNVDGQFVIKSRSTGAALVNIEAGTSNFTDIMGFTTTGMVDVKKDDGSIEKQQVSKMNIGTQEIGENAKIKINGTTYTATSNTITSDITRIKGLTINLKGLTKDSSVTLKVERDKETLANAVSGVVDSYNELMKNVDEAIASDGDLKNESTLKLIRNQLRNLMTSSDMGTTVFRNLDSIGISVAAASGNNIATTNSAIVSLAFDKDKFLKAYEADQDAVKGLIIGGANNKGIFTKVEDLVESTLKSVSGYFASTETSYANKIKDLDKKITKANKEVDRYKARLESKFQSMDMLIAQMQQQYSSFLTT